MNDAWSNGQGTTRGEEGLRQMDRPRQANLILNTQLIYSNIKVAISIEDKIPAIVFTKIERNGERKVERCNSNHSCM